MQRRLRRVALYLLFACIVVSAVIHFTIGSTVATLFPTWRYAAVPENAISIISLSHVEHEQPVSRPTPPPSPLPQIIRRTGQHLALLKYREMGANEARIAAIRPPARRKSNLTIGPPTLMRPGVKDAPVVSNQEQPTPDPSKNAAARVDTGGDQDELNGKIVWGDDNPPRVVRLAPVSSSNTPDHPTRIEVEVGPDGNVLSVKLLQSSGDANLDELVMDSARKTIFAPATLNGLPVHGTLVLEYPPAGTRST